MDPGTDVDHVLQSLGSLGRYQKFQLSLLFIFLLENAFHLIAANYVSYRPDYHCNKINKTEFLYNHLSDIPSNVSDIVVNYGKCKVDVRVNVTGEIYHYSESCPNGYEYDIPVDRSTVTEWDLVCEGAVRSEFAQTMIMMGQAVGAAIFSPLSDRYGRKKINIIARTLYLIAGITAMFSPSIAVFSVYRLLLGTFQGGSVMTGTTLCIEMLPVQHRHKGEGLAFLAWTTGVVWTSIIAYICRDLPWRYFQLILGVMSWHVIIDWLFFDESLRWLIANGRNNEAIKQIQKAARWNNKSYETIMEGLQKKQPLMPVEIEISQPMKEQNGLDTNETKNSNSESQEEVKVQHYSALTILKHRKILTMSLMLWFIWITNTLTYYGLILMTSKLAGDRYLNNVLAALAEFPAIIIQQIIINRIGRRYVLVLYHALASIALVLATVCTIYSILQPVFRFLTKKANRQDVEKTLQHMREYSWLKDLSTFFSILGRFAAIGSFGSVFLYTPELYPTNLRNVGLGMASTVSRIGSMVSPFAALLIEYVSWGPAAIFVVMNGIVVIILLTLPETMGRELPTTVEEMKSWFNEKKTIFDIRWPKSYKKASIKERDSR